jgi:uncharacterized protein (DUF2225 family)
MKVKCKHCNTVHKSEEWNEATERMCGKGFTEIEKGINSNNWYYICPSCFGTCFKDDREIIE